MSSSIIIANLPIEKAHEPNETAKQPQEQDSLKRNFKSNNQYVKSTQHQINSTFMEALSQPIGLEHRQKLLWLQKHRTMGLWVQCDDCDRWRYLSNVLDSGELPKKWYCRLHPDPTCANCSIPEAPLRVHQEEDLIHSVYSAGSVVWARLAGWPWWPAMVDDCPDTEQFYWLDGYSDIPTHYNVVFFDSLDVTRAWITPDQLKPYTELKNPMNLSNKDKKIQKRLDVAVVQANDAIKLTLLDRLTKYSFVNRYKGSITSPKKPNKRDLIRYQKKMKRKFNISFPIESSSESDEELRDDSDNLNAVDNHKTTKKERNLKVNGKDNTKGSNRKHIEETVELRGPDSTIEGDPKQNSMAVQVGSTVDSMAMTMSLDNDTSKTYVPETQTEPTEEQDSDILQNISIRMPSPSSDDFDF